MMGMNKNISKSDSSNFRNKKHDYDGNHGADESMY